MSFGLRLLSDDEDGPQSAPAVVFSDTCNPGFVPLWDSVDVYDSLYNSDGKAAREISKKLAFGLDRLSNDPGLARLLPPTGSMSEAIRFLENVLRACTTHPAARLQTS